MSLLLAMLSISLEAKNKEVPRKTTLYRKSAKKEAPRKTTLQRKLAEKHPPIYAKEALRPMAPRKKIAKKIEEEHLKKEATRKEEEEKLQKKHVEEQKWLTQEKEDKNKKELLERKIKELQIRAEETKRHIVTNEGKLHALTLELKKAEEGLYGHQS